MSIYQSYSEEELIALLKTGNKSAYTEIYNRYETLIYAFAYKRIDEREEARDIVHEVFLYFWEQRKDLVITTGLLPFMYSTVKNKILNRIKHKKVSMRYIDAFQEYLETSSESADHLLRYNELTVLIEKEIAALPKKMRQVFELSRKENYSRKDIATELGLSEETVKSHMHHALKLLKAKLGPLIILLFV